MPSLREVSSIHHRRDRHCAHIKEGGQWVPPGYLDSMIHLKAGFKCISHGMQMGFCPWRKLLINETRYFTDRYSKRSLTFGICSISLSYKTSAIYGNYVFLQISQIHVTEHITERPTQSAIAIFLISTVLILIARIFLSRWFLPHQENAIKEDLPLEQIRQSADSPAAAHTQDGGPPVRKAGRRRLFILAASVAVAGRVEIFRLLSRYRSCTKSSSEVSSMGLCEWDLQD